MLLLVHVALRSGMVVSALRFEDLAGVGVVGVLHFRGFPLVALRKAIHTDVVRACSSCRSEPDEGYQRPERQRQAPRPAPA